MSPSILKAPATAIEIVKQGTKLPTSEFKTLYDQMRRTIADVFPDEDQQAWSWESESGVSHAIEPPTWNATEWVCNRYLPSDRFSQRLAQRKFTLRSNGPPGTKINGKTPYPHQESLDDWDTIQGICSGVQNKACKTLIRAPYGSGKTLLGGRRMEAHKDLLLELLFKDGLEPDQLPTATILSLRKEIAIQNSLGGAQYTALRPPYTCELSHMRDFHKSMVAAFGDKFAEFFPKPRGKSDSWFTLFTVDEAGEEVLEGARRISDYLQKRGARTVKAFANWRLGDEAFSILRRLIQSEIILLPDTQNKPRVYEAPVRSGDVERQFTGDNAYALHADLGIRATHKDLLPDPAEYSSKIKKGEDPAHILIAHGTAISRPADRIRADIQQQIMLRHSHIIVDEGGKIHPDALSDTTEHLSGRSPNIHAATAKDEGIEGWTERSPQLDKQRCVQLNLTKSVAFQILAAAKRHYPVGSEGAWKNYREVMFDPLKIATKLKIPQPYEVDGLVVVPTKELREFAYRIEKAHEEEGIPVDLHCFDTKAGTDRWKVIEHGLKAPKNPGDPRRVIVAPPALLATGISMPIQCIDLLANLKPHELDQLLGRLFHIDNPKGSKTLRTYFRQLVHTGRCEVKLRDIAEQMGFELPEEGAVWIPGQAAIDLTAKERDDNRRAIGKAEPVPEARRPGKKEDGKLWQSIVAGNNAKSPYVKELLADAAERKRKKLLAAGGISEDDLSTVSKGKTVKASNGTLSVEFCVGPTGVPSGTALEVLAKEHGIWSYLGALRRDVFAAHRDGVRGTALAKVGLATIQRCQAAIQRMSGGRNGNGH